MGMNDGAEYAFSFQARFFLRACPFAARNFALRSEPTPPMKKLILAATLLLATARLAPASDEATDPVATADLELLARLLAPACVARGMTPKEVQANLGTPSAELAANVWAYWDFKAKDAPRGDRFDAALVIFANNHVERVKLCDGKAVRTFLAQQDARRAKNAVAAK
jgi:hypothetical protein